MVSAGRCLVVSRKKRAALKSAARRFKEKEKEKKKIALRTTKDPLEKDQKFTK